MARPRHIFILEQTSCGTNALKLVHIMDKNLYEVQHSRLEISVKTTKYSFFKKEEAYKLFEEIYRDISQPKTEVKFRTEYITKIITWQLKKRGERSSPYQAYLDAVELRILKWQLYNEAVKQRAKKETIESYQNASQRLNEWDEQDKIVKQKHYEYQQSFGITKRLDE